MKKKITKKDFDAMVKDIKKNTKQLTDADVEAFEVDANTVDELIEHDIALLKERFDVYR